MARLHSAAPKLKQPRPAKLSLVPDVREAPLPRCLVIHGYGHPDCPEFYVAVEAMEAVTQVLSVAMERVGRIGEAIGLIEKSWGYRSDESVWEWKVQVIVPHSISACTLELAKHMAPRNAFSESISLVPVSGYTVH